MEGLQKRKIILDAIRRQADENSAYCFLASLAEVAVNIGTRDRVVDLDKLEKQVGVTNEGRTPPNQFFRHLRAGADAGTIDKCVGKNGVMD